MTSIYKSITDSKLSDIIKDELLDSVSSILYKHNIEENIENINTRYTHSINLYANDFKNAWGDYIDILELPLNTTEIKIPININDIIIKGE